MKKYNKGIEIRNKKRKKNLSKIREVKEEQNGICRFVWIEYILFKTINGKARPYKKVANVGLQIDNKIYLNDGKFKYVNNKNLQIKKVFATYPAGASKLLEDKYDQQKRKLKEENK